MPTDRFDLLLDARPALPPPRLGAAARASHMQVDRRGADLSRRAPARPVRPAPWPRRAEAIARLKREINVRHGPFKLRSGATLPLTEIYGDSVNDYDICDIRGKACF